MNRKEKRLINKLHMKKIAIKINIGQRGLFGLGRCVRQGHCLSPTLFTLHSENMLLKVLEGSSGRSRIGGRSINCVSFGDNMVILVEDMREGREMIIKLYKY